MKIAITAQEPELTSVVDPRFGRARYFVVVDTDTGSFTVQNNDQNLNAPQGAGIQAARNVVELSVDAVVTGHCGPKAFAVLTAAGIKIYPGANGLTITDAVEKYKTGALTEASGADVDGHWV